jgi:NADH dehydrogenase
MSKLKVVVVGGGFSGISFINRLSKYDIFDITLVSDKTYFEYYPGIYRILNDKNPFELFIKLKFFLKRDIRFIKGLASQIVKEEKKVILESKVSVDYDILVISSGSNANDFGIEGVLKYAYFPSSLIDMMEARNSLLEDIQSHIISQNKSPYNIVIVGGGVTGIEVSGEVSNLLDTFSDNYGYDRDMLKVYILQNSDTILSFLPEKAKKIVLKRLRKLKVNFIKNTSVLRVYKDTIKTSSGSINYSFLFWSAGVKTNDFVLNSRNFIFSNRNKVVVDENFEAEDNKDIYVIGDNAETKFSGLAQIAEQDGNFLAKFLISKYVDKNKVRGRNVLEYKPRLPVYVIPVGKNFGVLYFKNFVISGFIPWVLRYLVDARFFFLHLKFKDFLSMTFEQKLR